MLKLIQNVECCCPAYTGTKDILICGDKIFKIQPCIPPTDLLSDADIIDGTGLMAMPGLIDQHVHILGGGGEDGFSTHIPPLELLPILRAGVTTLVGLLGADHVMRSLPSLFAKAKALEEQGITTYLYTGCYSVPVCTFTNSITDDLVLIDKVIGVGEIALSDHRSSCIGLDELRKIAAQTHLGGLLGEKAGVLHLHMGDGREGLQPVLDLVQATELPIEMIVPTHVNRDPVLFEQAITYCLSGGYIDLTSGETQGIAVPQALAMLRERGADMRHVTVSSDANGSIPGGGVGSIQTLYDDICTSILQKALPLQQGLSLATENVARRLHLYPRKGTLLEGSDADILLLDSNFTVKKVYSLGKLVYESCQINH